MTELTTNECAELLHTTRRSIFRWRHHGFPKPIRHDDKFGNIYDKADVLAWAVAVGKYDDLVGLPNTAPGQWWKGPTSDTFSTPVASEMLGYAPGTLLHLRQDWPDMPWPQQRVGDKWLWTAEDVAAAAKWIAARRSRRASV